MIYQEYHAGSDATSIGKWLSRSFVRFAVPLRDEHAARETADGLLIGVVGWKLIGSHMQN